MSEGNYEFEDCDEKMLEVMQNYEFDYEKIAQDIFKGKIYLPMSCRNKIEYDKLYSKLSDFFSIDEYDDEYSDEYEEIKYEKGILLFSDDDILNDINDILEIFNILVECLTEHGEYLKRYLQKRSELEKKLGLLDEENTTDDLF